MAISAGLTPGTLDWLDDLIADGVDTVQIREKYLGDRDLFRLVKRAVDHAGRLTVLVNGRADIALAAGLFWL